MPFATSQHSPEKAFKIHYKVTGELNGPTIVMLHASANDLQDWDILGYTEALGRDFRLVQIDLLGHGQSDKPLEPEDYLPELRAKDTIAVLDQLNLTNNVIFFGGSLGGRLGFTLALDPEYRQRFSAFIIHSATPYGTSKLGAIFASWFAEGMPNFVDRVEKAMGETYPDQIRKVVLANDHEAQQAANTLPWPDYSSQLSKIKAPCLLIVGDQDPIFEQVTQCSAMLPNSELAVFEGKSHARAYWDGANFTANATKKFMDRITSEEDSSNSPPTKSYKKKNAGQLMEKQRSSFKYLILLITLCATLLISTLVMQNRIVSIGHFYVCGAIFVYPFSYIILDIIAEVYGYQYARQTLWLTILATFIFASVISIGRLLPSPVFWSHYNNAFNLTTGPIFRSMSLGAASIVVGQIFNIYVITKLKIRFHGKLFIFRSILSTFLGDTATIAVAIFAIFAQRMNAGQIFTIIFGELILMYLFAFILSFPGSIIVKLLKTAENSDPYDTAVNFNPFSLKVD
jgi:queuosine precursor transporter